MRLAVFDIDGTLTRTNDVDSDCFKRALRTVLGIDEFETDWGKYQYVTDSGIAQEISHRYRDRPLTGAEMRELDKVMCDLLKAEAGTRFQQVEGADEFLRELNASNEIAVAIATGASEGPARLKLELAGLEVAEIPLASSTDAVVREHIMLQAMDRASLRHGVAFSKVTYFGDAAWDVEAAGNLGWNLIGIGNDLETSVRFDDYTRRAEILDLI